MAVTVLPPGRLRRYLALAMALWAAVIWGSAGYLHRLRRAEARKVAVEQAAAMAEAVGAVIVAERRRALVMGEVFPFPGHLRLPEHGAIRLLAPGGVTHGESVERGVVRARYPVRLERECLGCHAHAGAREGDPAGVVEVTLPFSGGLGEELAAWRFELAAAATAWLLGLAGMVVAATRYAAGQRRIELSEARLRALFEGARDALLVLDGERIAECNPAAGRLFGLPREAIVGRTPWELAPPEQPEGGASAAVVRERIAEALEGRPQLFEWVIRKEDGTDTACEVQLGRFEVEGQPLLLAALRDISRRKEQEAALHLLWRAVDQAEESVLITDAEGRIVFVNPAFERITGYSSEEAVGNTPRLLKSGQHPETFYRKLWETITAGGTWRGTFVNRRKDGTLYHEETVITPVRDDRGEIRYFVAVRHDVTRVRELEERLAIAQRMETIGQLAGMVAHDFNNLLMAILGSAEAAARRGGEAVEAEVESIRHAVQRGAELTRRLLAVGRQQVIEPVDMDLNRFLAEITPTLRRLIPENIHLEVVPCEEPAGVHADPGEIERILMNLVSNARDAMPGGGHLVIETSVTHLGGEYVREHPWAREGRFTVLAVSDDGIGMDQETLSHIFEPFFTTKPRDRGTGLGLATVYGLVDQHRGFINVYSEPGEGTTFRIYLPWVDVGAGTAPAAAPEAGLPEGSETVLVVEDDPGVREGLRGMLEGLGYRVFTAATGEEALELVRAGAEDLRLVITDVVLPGMDGGELARRIGAVRPGVRFLFTSGYTDNVVHDRFVARPGFRFLLKPYSLRQLAHAVREALDAPPQEERLPEA